MKKILVSMLMLIFIVSMITTVNAATGTVTLSASSDSVIKGKTFTVTVAAAGDNNVTGIASTLSYDTSKLLLENKATANGFTDISSGSELNAGILTTEGVTLSKSVTIYTLTFKALDEATEGDTTISLDNVELALVNEESVQEDVTAENASVTIKIKADDTTVDNQGGTNGTPEDDGNNTQNGNNSSNEDNSNNDDNKSSSDNKNTNKNKVVNANKGTNKNTTTKLPQTGAESASVVAIIALGAVSIASYVSYRKYKNI